MYLSKGLNSDKKPNIIKHFEIIEFKWCNTTPEISNIHIHKTLLNGEFCFSSNLYKENGPMIKLGIDIDVNNRFLTNFKTKIEVIILVKKISGKCSLYIPPPFVDKGFGWITFISKPEVELSLDMNIERINNIKYLKSIIEGFVLWKLKKVFIIISYIYIYY